MDRRTKLFLVSVALAVSGSLGAGIFSLPFVLSQSGLVPVIILLLLLGGGLAFCHVLYWQSLQRVEEHHRLLGLVRMKLGRLMGYVGTATVILGPLLTLIIFLLLAAKFLTLLFPGLPAPLALLLFWLFVSIPSLLSFKRFVGFEAGAVALTLVIIVFVLLNAPLQAGRALPALLLGNNFLTFSVILFALTGWTAVEPIFDWHRRVRHTSFRPAAVFATGMAVIVLLYLVFALFIVHSAALITPDTLSGITNWPLWQRVLLQVFALIAIAVSYLMLANEIKNALHTDLRWHKLPSVWVVIIVPLAVVLLGVRDFLPIMELVGGAVLALQYSLILLVGLAVVRPRGWRNALVHLLLAMFTLSLFYELYTFITTLIGATG